MDLENFSLPAQSAGETSVHTNPDLSRRSTLRGLLSGAGLLGASSLFGQQTALKAPANGPVVLAPATHTLLEEKTEKTDHGSKYFRAIQSVGANGVTSVSRVHCERVEQGKDYKVFLTATVLWYEPGKALTEPTEWVSTHSHVFTGQKGEVHGDHRSDTIASTAIFGNGSTVESTPRKVKVLLDIPEEIKGGSFQQQMEWLENRHARHGGMK